MAVCSSFVMLALATVTSTGNLCAHPRIQTVNVNGPAAAISGAQGPAHPRAQPTERLADLKEEVSPRHELT